MSTSVEKERFYSPSNTMYILMVFLLTAITLSQTNIPPLISYITISGIYMLVIILFLSQAPIIKSDREFILLFSILGAVIALRTIYSPNLETIVRLGVFFIFTGSNIFLLPQIIPFRDLAFIVSRIAAGSVVLGFLPYLGVSPEIGYIDFSLWGGRLYWLPTMSPITSIFDNPNSLGFLAMTGALLSLVEWNRSKNSSPKIIFSITSIGLLWTNYRTGMIALGVSLLIYSIYSNIGPQYILSMALSGMAFISITFLMMFNAFPGPEFLTGVDLNGRRILWSAGYNAIVEEPILGSGFGNAKSAIQPYLVNTNQYGSGVHNSYLRMFISLGIIGGILYIFMVIYSITRASREAYTHSTAVLSITLIAYSLVQIFNGLTFIGISMISALMAIIIGYTVTPDA